MVERLVFERAKRPEGTGHSHHGVPELNKKTACSNDGEHTREGHHRWHDGWTEFGIGLWTRLPSALAMSAAACASGKDKHRHVPTYHDKGIEGEQNHGSSSSKSESRRRVQWCRDGTDNLTGERGPTNNGRGGEVFIRVCLSVLSVRRIPTWLAGDWDGWMDGWMD
ncbi:hypothetical protein BKA81DRAFT_348981 [Phyllosticta paracitricarpa]